jgi:hypothetical protein
MREQVLLVRRSSRLLECSCREVPPVVRIAGAFHSDFISVVDQRRAPARQQKLKCGF